jgi:hypothetical protein
MLIQMPPVTGLRMFQGSIPLPLLASWAKGRRPSADVLEADGVAWLSAYAPYAAS